MIEKFYNAYINTLNMLVIRKYITNEEKEKYNYPIKDFVVKKTNDISSLDIKNIYTPTGKPVIVLFIEDDIMNNYRTGKATNELLLNRVSEEELLTSYIICIYQSKSDDDTPDEITTANIKKEKLLQAENKHVQFLNVNIMAIDRFNNCIMPEIKMLSKDEIIEFNRSSMSVIEQKDAITRYYGASVGDIFQFTRKMSTGPNISWRRVV